MARNPLIFAVDPIQSVRMLASLDVCHNDDR